MKVNKSKSGILFLQKERGQTKQHEHTYRGYPVVMEYKYLGV